MPLVDVNDSYTLDHYYDQGLFKKLNRPEEAALSYKLEIAQNLSALVAELHKHQHYFIDFKPQNIRVFRRTHVVTLLDCDGFSIFGNGRRYPAELLSTDYIAPEAQRRNSSPADLAEPQDRYALAVILFQLLNRGTHPFQGIVTAPNITVSTNDEKAAAGLYPHGLTSDTRIKPRPQSTHHLWPDETRALFDQAFTTGSPSARPSAEDWSNHFKLLLSTKALVRCERFPNELEHIRFKEKSCPTCYLSGLPPIQPQTKHKVSKESPIPSPATPPLPAGSNTGWWIVGGAITLFLLITFNSNNGSHNARRDESTETTIPKHSTTSPAPNISNTQPPPEPTKILLGTKEEKPPKAAGQTLTENQDRYCESETTRLVFLHNVIEKEGAAVITLYNIAHDDYVSRCKNYFVESEALGLAVKAQVASNSALLEQQARDRLSRWRKQADLSNAPSSTQTPVQQFDVNKQY